ncbi:MAG: hypothetical protein VXW65_07670 [Pseudomonadota bacterium]|nr:hypothetical protein [Pseudomonadota bacterium]
MKPELSDDYDDLQDDDLDSPEVEDGAADVDDAEESEEDRERARQKADELAEAESLTVTAKKNQRQQLEDELARFLAQGGRITEVPPDDTVRD